MDEYEKKLDEYIDAHTQEMEGMRIGSSATQTMRFTFLQGRRDGMKCARSEYRSMTCKMEYLDEPTAFYRCSECGTDCCENCAEHPRYCPNCGRRVVEEKE